jgi:hypothetical protein
MDDETLKRLLALRGINKALITGLNAAIDILKHETVLDLEIRHSMVESLKGLITLSEEIYGKRQTVH